MKHFTRLWKNASLFSLFYFMFSVCTAQTPDSKDLPQLGKASIKKVIAAMTSFEEKAKAACCGGRQGLWPATIRRNRKER